LLEACKDITRIIIKGPQPTARHVTALSPLQQRILEILGCPSALGSSALNRGERHWESKRRARHTLPGMLPSHPRRRSWTPQSHSAPIGRVPPEAKEAKGLSVSRRAQSRGASASRATNPSPRRQAPSATGCVPRLSWW
jgi:hypothetical protein